MKFISEIIQAIRVVNATPRARFAYFLLAIGLFVAMFLLPVWSVPGNDVAFQAKLFTAYDYIVMVVFAVLSALLFLFHAHIIRAHLRARRRATNSIMEGLLGIFAGFVSALFASATCVFCLGAFVGLLGFSAITILLSWRWYVVVVAAIILVLSLYLAARRINRGCEVCVVPS